VTSICEKELNPSDENECDVNIELIVFMRQSG